MNRKEFLEILRSQLAGQMQEGKAAAHIRYYEDYIQSQVRGGRSEQEVLQELGIYLTISGLSFNITFGLYQIDNDRESIKKNG